MELTMPYGKFKGKTMEEILSGYLLWLAENHKDGRICYAADEEWRLRERECNHWEEY